MTPAAYDQFSKEIASYISCHCDGSNEGFEVEYEGSTASVSYEAEIRVDAGLDKAYTSGGTKLPCLGEK